ncbi:hypothetical protein ACIQNT_12500 [Streptomyces luteogriseus]|uniref:hypothetical protein n=1 Tax=Streptomyces luteogriseus TaxID=68233 RepID=UPI00382353FA
MSYSVILDAGTLVPGYLRNALLHLAAYVTYRPLWTERIWAEALQEACQLNPLADRARLEQINKSIQSRFGDDAMVTGWERHESAMTNNVQDRHVLAAAVASNANGVVTTDPGSFPEPSRQPFSLALYSPDDFLVDRLNWTPSKVLSAVEAQAAETARGGAGERLSAEDILDKLEEKVPNFAREAADALRQFRVR